MLNRRKLSVDGKAKRLGAITVAVAVFLGILFAPTLVTVAWHLCRRNPIECAGQGFLVPLRWYPSIDNRTLTISMLSLIIRPNRPVSALITLSPAAIPPKTDLERESAYRSFVAMYWTQMANPTGRIRGPIRLGTKDRQAYCLETTFENAERGMSVACLALGATWIASYDGPPKKVDTFYKIITLAPPIK
jgi:hypothetical protein